MFSGAAVQAKKPGWVNEETDAERGARGASVGGCRSVGGSRSEETCSVGTVALDRPAQVGKGSGTIFLMLQLCFEMKGDGVSEAVWNLFFFFFPGDSSSLFQKTQEPEIACAPRCRVSGNPALLCPHPLM